MNHQDFKIGMEFWCRRRRWRCTDRGTRTILAICLEPHEVVSIAVNRDDSFSRTSRHIVQEGSWFKGPPYAVAESVFDENDIGGCTPLPDDPPRWDRPAAAVSAARRPIFQKDPDIMSGTICFAGTRVPLRTVFDYVCADESLKEFLENFPSVSQEQARDALQLAFEALDAQEAWP